MVVFPHLLPNQEEVKRTSNIPIGKVGIFLSYCLPFLCVPSLNNISLPFVISIKSSLGKQKTQATFFYSKKKTLKTAWCTRLQTVKTHSLKVHGRLGSLSFKHRVTLRFPVYVYVTDCLTDF